MIGMNKAGVSTSEILNDDEIITRILHGEKDLYSLIVRRYNQRLYRIGMSIINDDAEVEDAMQVAYINAYENLGKFAFKSSFPTWLTRILINECLLRLRKRKKSISMNDENIEKVMKQNKELHTPATATVNAELRSILNDAIGKLPEIYRSVFVMREIENMNIAETKECLNISEVNVKVRLNRAKALLRDILSAQYSKEDILHFHLSRCDRMVEKVMTGISNL
ncbi:MAG: RNA polymerase sigma factor [Bacteroidetes bacterium]|nr:MAG: RNA polymerase sigma factor [Bacteroidota bacterium]